MQTGGWQRHPIAVVLASKPRQRKFANSIGCGQYPIYYHRQACRRCPIRARCTNNASHRQIARWEGEALLDQMQARLDARSEMLRVRREAVEHPFGSIRQWMNQGAFLTRGFTQRRRGV